MLPHRPCRLLPVTTDTRGTPATCRNPHRYWLHLMFIICGVPHCCHPWTAVVVAVVLVVVAVLLPLRRESTPDTHLLQRFMARCRIHLRTRHRRRRRHRQGIG